MSPGPSWPGYLFALLAAFCWASAGTLAKFMMSQALSPIVLAEMRVTFASAILGLILALKRPALLRISRRDLLYMLVLGVVGVAGVHYSYYYAISKTNVATAILLQYLAPALILIFAVFVQGESFSPAKVISMCLAFSGCFFMVGGYDLQLFELNKAGLLGGLASAFFFAFYSVYGEYGLRKYSVWTILFYGFSAATGFWWCLNPPWKIVAAHYSLQTWLLFLFLGIFSAIVPFALYFSSMRYIKATRACISAMSEPMLGGFIAYLFLGEHLALPQIFGAALVMAGILWLQLSRQPA